MRVLICGSRGWKDEERIELVVSLMRLDTVIVHGDATGADRMSGRAALRYGLVVEPYPANWKEFGKAAGPIRNKEMLDTDIDLVIAFYTTPITPGTADMISQALRRKVPVLRISNL